MIIHHPNHPNGGYYMEQALWDNISVLPKRIEKDKDVCFVVVGSPGEGKSTLVQQLMYALDNKFNINDIKWSYEDYVRHSLALFQAGKSKGRSVVHDEGKEALSAVSIMSRRTKKFMDFLYENRQMNMYQGILTGDFFDLPKSIVMQRLMFMVWVHEEGEFENGHFKFFNREDLRKLYVYGKKERNMAASHYSFRGTFSKFYTVDEAAYRKQKQDHLKVDRYLDDPTKKKLTVRQTLYAMLRINPKLTRPEAAHSLGKEKSRSTINQYFDDYWAAAHEESPEDDAIADEQLSNNQGGEETDHFRLPSPNIN